MLHLFAVTQFSTFEPLRSLSAEEAGPTSMRASTRRTGKCVWAYFVSQKTRQSFSMAELLFGSTPAHLTSSSPSVCTYKSISFRRTVSIFSTVGRARGALRRSATDAGRDLSIARRRWSICGDTTVGVVAS